MEELDLKELFMIFWNKKIEIILITIMFLAIGVIYSYVIVKPIYSASTTLVLATSQSTENMEGTSITEKDISLNSNLVPTYRELIKSKLVLREVIENLNIEGLTEGLVRENVAVKSVQNTELIEIAVKNQDPNVCAEVANEIAKVFSNKIIEIYNISNVYIVDRAEAINSPCNINHKKDLILFGFIGIIASVALILITNMLDTTIKTEEDVEKVTGLLVLSSIPNYEIEVSKRKGGRR